jgi:hypothetical protein
LLSKSPTSSPFEHSLAVSAITVDALTTQEMSMHLQSEETRSTMVDKAQHPTLSKSDTWESQHSTGTALGEVSRDGPRDRTRSMSPVKRLRRSMSPVKRLRRSMSPVKRLRREREPVLQAIPKSPPLLSDTFPDTDFDDICGAISVLDNCITLQHLKAVGCQDIQGTGWKPCPDNIGHQIRKMVYTLPVPPDAAPSAVAKLLGVPKALQMTMVQRLCSDGHEMTLVEQAYTQDVVYLDRCLAQYVRHFSRNTNGGVDMRLWVETVWTRDLPFTHFAVKSLVEKKTRNEAIADREGFKRIVQTAAKECHDSRQQVA